MDFMSGGTVQNRGGESHLPLRRNAAAGDLAQRCRLVSGLVLFTFAATHFINHALGLINLETMHEFQQWRWVVTRSSLGTAILGLALLVHVVLALFKLAMRATLRLSAWELLQLGLGLAIPFLLFPHIVNTRIARTLFGVDDIYLYELARLWPASSLLQSVLLVIVWVHGCIGLHKWLSFKSWYRRLMPLFFALAVALPLLALCGFMISGRAVSELRSSAGEFSRLKDLTRWPSAETEETLAGYRLGVRVFFASALAVAFGAFLWRRFASATAPHITITYTGGPAIRTTGGPTLLEISRMHKIPHASACGGRARCSTCRVRIEQAQFELPLPAFAEAFTLSSIGSPQNVRLACQIRPHCSLTVTPLVREAILSPSQIDPREPDAAGSEKLLAIMMLDLRDFTELAQGRLPYDTVYMLNEFFAAAGNAIATHGGTIDKFIGDGLLAFFGRERGVEAGCREALCAARAIDLALDHLNAKLGAELGKALRVVMGLHAGPCLIGRIGYASSADVTVIGNTVNVASRFEALAKALGFQIVVSKEVADYAFWTGYESQTKEVEVRGISSKMQIIGITRGRDLPISILAPSPKTSLDA
jgi:adenylate cyclase